MRKRKMIVAIVMNTSESLLSRVSMCLSILCDYLQGDLAGLCHCQLQRRPDMILQLDYTTQNSSHLR